MESQPPVRRFRAGGELRLKRREDISRVFDHGRRANDSLLTLLAVPRQGGGESRFAVAVGKRHGGAVRRNRLKRLCREAFRLVRHELPSGQDYVLLPRAGRELTVAGLEESLRRLAARVASEPTGQRQVGDGGRI